MRERLSNGERRHIRRVKAEIRTEPSQFLTDENVSIRQLREMTGSLSTKEETLLRKWWQIRKEFAETKEEGKFNKKYVEFKIALDEDQIESQSFFTALKFITDSFTRSVGR